MGNVVSRRRRRRHTSPQYSQDDEEQVRNSHAFAPLPSDYPNTILPPYYYHHYPQTFTSSTITEGQLPHGPHSHIQRLKTVSIKNEVIIKKETLRMEPDQHNPHHFLLSFSFDATAPGCITVMYFATETSDAMLIALKKSLLKQTSVPFEKGLGQNFRQPCGSGIETSMLEEIRLTKGCDAQVYPLVLKAEAPPLIHITLATFEKKEKGVFKVQVLKQVFWVNGKRYELQEIYGIRNASDKGSGRGGGGDCVICLSEPRDITVLPCHHMCMCGGCASLLKVHTAKCPICRHPVERLLEIKLN